MVNFLGIWVNCQDFPGFTGQNVVYIYGNVVQILVPILHFNQFHG